MADRTKDRTKAVVERSTAKGPTGTPSEVSGEITAPLCAAELAAELNGGADGELTVTQALPALPATQVLPKVDPAADPTADNPTADNPTADDSAPGDPTADGDVAGDADSGPVDGAADPADDSLAAAAGGDEAAGTDGTEAAGTTDEAPDDGDVLPERLPVPERRSGDRIADRYRLEECISHSEVFSSWRAMDEKLRRAVGVHLLAAGSRRAENVLAAARAAALLGDPRFVQVLDAVQEGELVYVIREWLPDATDLATLFADGPMAPYDAYQMVRQVTDAVAAAHYSGRSHLRLTPRCVLRTDTGQYRINGVAVDAALRGLPEQGAELTDTQAIGTLLYAALTHRWPQPEDRYGLTGLPEADGLVPPERLHADVHPGLADLATRVLGEPAEQSARITSPAALAEEIARLPRIRQPEPDPAAPGRAAPRYPAPGGTRTQVPRPVPPGAGHRPPGPPTHPPTHPPARPAPPRTAPGPRPRRLGRQVLKWTTSVVLLAAIGYGSWQLAGQLGSTNDKQALGGSALGSTPSVSASPLPKPTPLAISGIQSFNPYGTGPMHTDLLSRINSGNPTNAWSTDGYYQDLTALGHGTGLLIDLGSAKPVSSVAVQFIGSTTAELRVPTAQGANPPAQLSDFGQPLATATGEAAQFQPGTPVTSRYLLIWLTSLPKDGSGSYRGQVTTIKVTG
ncbi:protein kinase family protein [Kitasatospora sp. NBC_01287]|uniref:protein kinase family protein n=1 Tax=Kitasatospora sp. NBC_01287 TaxID=2903573 RepID=UPI002259CF83|nr:protein kinase family protein [Kitasatospora sp. NBC_01287]MCX4747658.1 protein kinase family protein [Kitasatospora sp. NBC_01287]